MAAEPCINCDKPTERRTGAGQGPYLAHTGSHVIPCDVGKFLLLRSGLPDSTYPIYFESGGTIAETETIHPVMPPGGAYPVVIDG